MASQHENASPQPKPPSFFGVPESVHLWARVGARFWGGLLAGVGLGLFAAKFLEDGALFKNVWVGFIAIVLVGGGLGIAMQAARRSLKPDQVEPQKP